MSLVGSTILHYTILDEIGRGGMGVVYRAHDAKLDRVVALKFVPGDQGPETRDRFLREARAASRLNHRSIVSIHAIEHTGNRDFIVMEFVDGSPLRQLIDDGVIGPDHALIFARDVASALAAAHHAGVVHRDIKPENILISVDGTPKVLDFGIAKIEGSERLTQTDATLGTVAYMSPEQARGEPIDGRSDIFSLGVILYEMVAGTQPFRGAYPAETTFRILNEEPEPLSTHSEDVSSSLQNIVSKCLQKDADQRYRTADELEDDLAALSTGQPVSAAESSTASSGLVSRRRLARRPIWPIAGIVLVLAAVGGYFAFAPRAPEVRSIAVLPFENSTNDPNVDFLCDGIPESIINRLTYVPDFKVISRVSSFSFRDKADNPSKVGEALGVRTLLLGRLQRRGDDLAINAELVDTRDNSQIWGERFTRPVSEVMNIEEEIAGSIAEELRLQVAHPGAGPTARTPTDPQAYQLYMKGRHLILGSEEEMENAVKYFRQATEIEPDFGDAWAGIAEGLALQAYLQYSTRDELLADAKAALGRAMSIDPDSPNTLVAKSLIDLFFNWDFRSAEAAVRRAIEISPGLGLAHTRLTEVLMAEDRVEEAHESAVRALELDPVAVGANHDLGIILFMLGRYDEAAARFKQAVEVHPTWVWGYIKGALATASAGHPEQAIELIDVANEQTDGWGSPLIRSWIAHAYARAGRHDLAQAQVDLMFEHKKTEHVDAISLGYALVAVGDFERAIDWIEVGIQEQSPDGIWLKVSGSHSLLKPIGKNPRFQALIARLDETEM